MVQAVTDYYLAAISRLEKKPAVIGHSFGGLIVQKIAGKGRGGDHGSHRQRSLQRGSAAADFLTEVGGPGPREPVEPSMRRAAILTARHPRDLDSATGAAFCTSVSRCSCPTCARHQRQNVVTAAIRPK
jgi:pimeloyl-ACP methyl ester carboxylesterase